MNNPRCDGCRYFALAAFLPNDTKVIGECRRYPPPHRSRERGDVAYFPFISPDDWCGEYRPNAASRADASAAASARLD
jgi:hypothetical protein